MATFNTAFGSLPGYKEMMGTTNSTAGGDPTVYGGKAQALRSTQAPAQTFAKMQEQGLARPAAPPRPTATPFATYGGSEQGQELRTQLQQRLTAFGEAPSRYDTESFKQIRGAQAANLQSEYSAQQKALNEDLARRGLSASSIGGGRMGDLAGQQARALSSLDAQLLQQAADTQAQDRAQLMQSGRNWQGHRTWHSLRPIVRHRQARLRTSCGRHSLGSSSTNSVGRKPSSRHRPKNPLRKPLASLTWLRLDRRVGCRWTCSGCWDRRKSNGLA